MDGMAAFLLAMAGMKLSHVAALFALAMPVLGCASDPVAGGGDEAQGDVNAKGTEFDCVIVEVLDDLLEEGLGSIYDYDSDGFPDWVFWHARHGLLFRELKRKGAYLSPAQRSCHARMKAAGLDVEVWKPGDEELVVTTFRGVT